MCKSFKYVHVLDVSSMRLYIFPSGRFRREGEFGFNQPTEAISYYEPYYYSLLGVWRRTFARKRKVDEKKLGAQNFVLYSDVPGGGSLYSALWYRNLLVYVPPAKDVEQYLLLFLATALKAGGTLGVLHEERVPTSAATSYDVCHRVSHYGLCDKYKSHQRFCQIVGTPSDSDVFKSPKYMASATTLPLNSVYFPYPDNVDKLALDGSGVPVWKHFSTVCAYPHSHFGMSIGGELLCGPGMPWQASERCSGVRGRCQGKCAEEHAMMSRREIDAAVRYVSHYGGSYNSMDSLFSDYEVSYVPSFGYQLIYYVSKSNSVGVLKRSTEMNICTCMLSDVPCDSFKCYKQEYVDKEFTITSTGALFEGGVSILIPPTVAIETLFRCITQISVPDRLLEQCYRSRIMSYNGFSLFDYMYSPHAQLD